MKWVLFAIALAAVVPLSQWLRNHPRELSKVWILFGFMPLGFNPSITPIDWSGWPGYVFGFQITALDLLALALLFIIPRARQSVPFRFVMGFYFAAVVLSILPAQVPMAASFYAIQLARVFLVYLVVTRACADERVADAILAGLTIGLCYQAIVTVWQRFGLGILQTGGSFGDKNLLGLAAEFAVFPVFALLLGGKRGWYTFLAPIAGLIVAVMTTSRAAVGLGVIGLMLVFVLSTMRGWTSRKARVLLAGAIVAALASPIAIYSFQKRFAADPGALEYDERAVFEKAASLILSDHPFGIGANNYVVAANSGNYTERAGVPWGGNQRRSIVHNVYWLTAAETGYLGVIAFVILLFKLTLTAFRCSWMNQKDMRGDFLLGLGVSLIILMVHSLYEWVFVLYPVQYIFAMTAGMVGGLATQLGYWGQRVQNQAAPSSSHGFIAGSTNAPLPSFRNKNRAL